MEPGQVLACGLAHVVWELEGVGIFLDKITGSVARLTPKQRCKEQHVK